MGILIWIGVWDPFYIRTHAASGCIPAATLLEYATFQGNSADDTKNHPFRRSRRGRRSSTALGQNAEVTIDNLSLEGRGVARLNGKTLFVEGALPGERVQVSINQVHKRHDEARLTALIEASSERRAAPCSHYQQCGGCQLQHLAPESQLAYKQTLVLDQLQRFADLRPEQLEPPLSGPDLGYRRSARIGINQRADGSLLIGFRRPGSHRLVDVDHCPVLEPRLNRLLSALRETLQRHQGALKQLTHAEITAGDESAVLSLRITRPLPPALLRCLAEICSAQGVQLRLEENQGLRALPLPVPELHYRLEPLPLELHFEAGDFLQVNASINRQMVARALQWLAPTPEDRVLDLFCGLGNFTLPLALHAGQVVAVEGAEEMVQRARENARRNGLENVQVYRSDLSADIRQTPWYSQGQREGFDLILLDPPRAGAREAVEHLIHYQARRILYVACNPSALVRDAHLLGEAGYRLSRFCVMDMFPHTAHIESMALFEC